MLYPELEEMDKFLIVVESDPVGFLDRVYFRINKLSFGDPKEEFMPRQNACHLVNILSKIFRLEAHVASIKNGSIVGTFRP